MTEATGTEDGKKTGTALTGKGEPMSDLISRQAAIDAVKKLSLGETDATRLAMRIGDYLERLPPVQLSLESIVHPQILDDAEKRYLSAVIRPFRDRVKYIEKIDCACEEYIYIQVNRDWTILPRFKDGTMYKGMEPGHKYTPEELGL